MKETSGERRPNLKMGAKDGKPFTAKNQPTPEQKKRGWSKRKLLKELLELSVAVKIGKGKKDFRKTVSDFFQINERDVTVKMIMEYSQIERAIRIGDTFAFNAIMDRAFGKASQSMDITSAGKPISNKLEIEIVEPNDEE